MASWMIIKLNVQREQQANQDSLGSLAASSDKEMDYLFNSRNDNDLELIRSMAYSSDFMLLAKLYRVAPLHFRSIKRRYQISLANWSAHCQ